MKKALSFLIAYVGVNLMTWFLLIPLAVGLALVYPRGAVVLAYSGTRGLELYTKKRLEEIQNG